MNSHTSPTAITTDEPQVDVSVVIPVYNCERYLDETIGSVRDQDIGDGRYEIIAVDDGSTDGSLDTLDRLAVGESDLRVFSIPNSGSAAAPRNLGVDEARGRYIFFLDADDKLAPDTLRRTVNTADETESGVVLCKMGEFGAGKRAGNVPSAAFGATKFAVDFIESRAASTLGALKLFRTSIIKEHNVRFPLGFVVGEDQAFTMQAYLHSPHVSILADKVYYWARGRGDGTNVTSAGQPPRKHLKRILTLIRTIVDNTEPSELRDKLLRRPIVGSAGVISVFGKKMLPAHNRTEREAMLNEFRDLVEPLWNPAIRDHGLPVSQILVDLAIRNDLDEIESVSRLLLDKRPLPLTLDRDHKQFVYHPSKGGPIGDLNIKPEPTLETISSVGRSLKIRGEIGIPGVNAAPDSAQLIFRNRKLGTKVIFKLNVSRSYSRSFGVWARFSTRVDSSKFNDSGVWEAIIKASWSSVVFRQPFGELRSKALNSSPLLIGDPIEAIAFFTRNDILAVDIGPTEKHLDPVKSSELQIIDHFQVGRSAVLVLNGRCEHLATASIRLSGNAKEKPAELVLHSTSQASIVVSRTLTKRQGWALQLTDKAGNEITVPSIDVNR
ncbi:glycosyltransferase family 2 protein [Brevibacterium sp. K11IcPPYGO002]|uniref:glycosyltransferase family 2 protein n=1 Tax=Brevibacterium sp. K11IcPPYGO002 TaxID=3058837 RepID=UPI003D814DEE